MEWNQCNPGEESQVISRKAVGKENAGRGGEKDQANGPLTHRANLAEGEGGCNLTSSSQVDANASSARSVPALEGHPYRRVRRRSRNPPRSAQRQNARARPNAPSLS